MDRIYTRNNDKINAYRLWWNSWRKRNHQKVNTYMEDNIKMGPEERQDGVV
jgi:hypothetical protein